MLPVAGEPGVMASPDDVPGALGGLAAGGAALASPAPCAFTGTTVIKLRIAAASATALRGDVSGCFMIISLRAYHSDPVSSNFQVFGAHIGVNLPDFDNLSLNI